jgi:dGTP triphosphohydrolase
LKYLYLARLDSDSVYHDRAREFNDPNFGFSESCTKKNALTKLARMSRVRHNAKSIENRYNSLKILTKLFETFAHSTKLFETFLLAAVSMSKFLVKLFHFPEISSKCRVIYG